MSDNSAWKMHRTGAMDGAGHPLRINDKVKYNMESGIDPNLESHTGLVRDIENQEGGNFIVVVDWEAPLDEDLSTKSEEWSNDLIKTANGQLGMGDRVKWDPENNTFDVTKGNMPDGSVGDLTNVEGTVVAPADAYSDGQIGVEWDNDPGHVDEPWEHDLIKIGMADIGTEVDKYVADVKLANGYIEKSAGGTCYGCMKTGDDVKPRPKTGITDQPLCDECMQKWLDANPTHPDTGRPTRQSSKTADYGDDDQYHGLQVGDKVRHVTKGDLGYEVTELGGDESSAGHYSQGLVKVKGPGDERWYRSSEFSKLGKLANDDQLFNPDELNKSINFHGNAPYATENESGWGAHPNPKPNGAVPSISNIEVGDWIEVVNPQGQLGMPGGLKQVTEVHTDGQFGNMVSVDNGTSREMLDENSLKKYKYASKTAGVPTACSKCGATYEEMSDRGYPAGWKTPQGELLCELCMEDVIENIGEDGLQNQGYQFVRLAKTASLDELEGFHIGDRVSNPGMDGRTGVVDEIQDNSEHGEDIKPTVWVKMDDYDGPGGRMAMLLPSDGGKWQKLSSKTADWHEEQHARDHGKFAPKNGPSGGADTPEAPEAQPEAGEGAPEAQSDDYLLNQKPERPDGAPMPDDGDFKPGDNITNEYGDKGKIVSVDGEKTTVDWGDGPEEMSTSAVMSENYLDNEAPTDDSRTPAEQDADDYEQDFEDQTQGKTQYQWLNRPGQGNLDLDTDEGIENINKLVDDNSHNGQLHKDSLNALSPEELRGIWQLFNSWHEAEEEDTDLDRDGDEFYTQQQGLQEDMTLIEQILDAKMDSDQYGKEANRWNYTGGWGYDSAGLSAIPTPDNIVTPGTEGDDDDASDEDDGDVSQGVNHSPNGGFAAHGSSVVSSLLPQPANDSEPGGMEWLQGI